LTEKDKLVQNHLKAIIMDIYGHVAIVSKVEDSIIEIIQQNPGPFAYSREKFKLRKKNNLWIIDNKRILGRLSK
jgi:surface antigen